MLDVEPRAVAELHRLAGEGKGTRNNGLRSDDGRRGGEHNQGVEGPVRGKVVEGVFRRSRGPQQERSLPEVVEQQAGERDAEPGDLDRAMPEVAEVCVQRLAARDDEEDGAQHHETAPQVLAEEEHRVVGGDRCQHPRLSDDLAQPKDADGAEPDQHYRSEERADPCRPAALQEEQADQDHERHWDHPGSECRRRDLEPLNGAQHGDRRREGTVGIQERRPENSEHDHDAAGRKAPGEAGAVDERHQGQHAPFTLIVRADDHNMVLDRDDEDQRPEHEREDPQHVAGTDGDPVGPVEGLAHRVQWARADVAVDHAQRGEGERGEVATARSSHRFRP